jgi:formylglycine-generating enzyme required for sulfatase activity
MTSNTWEWTTDPFTDSHARTPCRRPDRGTGETGARRVLEGVSHLRAPNYCLRYRPAARQGGRRYVDQPHRIPLHFPHRLAIPAIARRRGRPLIVSHAPGYAPG